MEKSKERILNDKLVEIVKERGISLKTLGTAIGLKTYNPNLYNWRNGKLTFKFKTLEKIADVLGLDAKIILEEQ